MRRIVIGTPYDRYDSLDAAVRARLDDWDVVRIRERGDLNAGHLRQLDPRYVFLPHWSWRVPDAVFEEFETVIFHMTDLPFGRGGSPLQNLIARGIDCTKLSALRCVHEIDAGPIYCKSPLPLHGSAEEILARAAEIMVSMIVDIVRQQPAPVAQEGEPTYFSRRGPEDGNISGLRDLQSVYDYIRMLDAEGYPPAYLEVGELRLELTGARLDGDEIVARAVIRPRVARGGPK